MGGGCVYGKKDKTSHAKETGQRVSSQQADAHVDERSYLLWPCN